jgi:hypothetical protein
MGEMRHAYSILVREPEGKTPHRRTRCRWEDNISMYLREIGWGGVDCITLLRRDLWWVVVNTVMNLQLP